MALSEASRVIAANNRNVAMATKDLEVAVKNHENSIATKEPSKAAFEADCRAEEVARQGVDAAKADLEDAKKHQQEDYEYYKAIVGDGDEPQPKKARVYNDGEKDEVAVGGAASEAKEVNAIECPDEIVVEGAGTPEVNGVYKRSVYKRSSIIYDVPMYTMNGKSEYTEFHINRCDD
jgi:hypothetical protein